MNRGELRHRCKLEAWRASIDDAERRRQLSDLRLETIVKESHEAPVTCLRYSDAADEFQHLVAAVGGNQVTVYDDAYLGPFIQVAVQFTNVETAETRGGGLSCCAWLLDTKRESPCLAVAGADPNVTIVDVGAAKVLTLLKGHKTRVVALEGQGVLLASLDSSGELRIWDVFERTCFRSFSTGSSSIAWDTSRRRILVGEGTRLKILALCRNAAVPGDLYVRESWLSPRLDGGPADVKRIVHLSDEAFALCLSNGTVGVFGYGDGSLRARIDCAAANIACFAAASFGGGVICVEGRVKIYDAANGAEIATHEVPQRLKGPVLSCACSLDQMHLLVAASSGYICRFEHPLAKEGREENATE